MQVENEKARAEGRAFTFVDAFAGCGGLSLGLMRAGWIGHFAIEKDRFAFETLRENFLGPRARYSYRWPDWLEQRPWAVEDLLSNHLHDLKELRGKVDLLAGGPPCQGFSSAGRRRAVDPRNELVERYLELVDIIRPKIVLMENVLGITYDFKVNGKRGKPVPNFANKLKERLSSEYHVVCSTLRACEFGVPQQRPRFFLVAISKTQNLDSLLNTFFDELRKASPSFLSKRNIPRRVAARTAISDLEVGRNGTVPCPDSNGYVSIAYGQPRSNFQRAMRDGHEGPPSDTRLAKHRPEIEHRFKRIISLCHAKGRLNVQLSREMRQKFGLKKMATRVLDPEQPAPTITSMPDDLLHYSEPRTLTVRENARLQTFPDWFVFKGKYTTGGEMRRREVPRFTQVANAVPPLLAELIGEVLCANMREAARPEERSRQAA
ncbi:DNA cytosine methyltransferase [Bradyrhizobium oligotrophicum]|uniref:DNA cytosine methyltransferase n=1 Tax=Bradyrhizobium TaxID=374 RepID=UPI003EC10CEF